MKYTLILTVGLIFSCAANADTAICCYGNDNDVKECCTQGPESTGNRCSGYAEFDYDIMVCVCKCDPNSSAVKEEKARIEMDNAKEETGAEKANWEFKEDDNICDRQCAGQKACIHEKYTWNQKNCRCECDTSKACENSKKEWDKETCECKCKTTEICPDEASWDEETCTCKCPDGYELQTQAWGSAVFGGGGTISNGGICCPKGQLAYFPDINNKVAKCCSGNLGTGINSGGNWANSGCSCPEERRKTNLIQEWWYPYISVDSDMCCPVGTRYINGECSDPITTPEEIITVTPINDITVTPIDNITVTPSETIPITVTTTLQTTTTSAAEITPMPETTTLRTPTIQTETSGIRPEISYVNYGTEGIFISM